MGSIQKIARYTGSKNSKYNFKVKKPRVPMFYKYITHFEYI